MASNENIRQPLLDPALARDTSYVKYTALPMSSTTLNITSEPLSKAGKKRRSRPIDKRSGKSSFETSSTGSLKEKLTTRKKLQCRLSNVTDIMCCVSIVSIILMVVENEITFQYIDDQDTVASWWIKLVITILTVFLIGLIFLYHRLDLNLYASNNSIDDWRVGLTNRRILTIILEVIFCAIHPIPRSYPSTHPTLIRVSQENTTVEPHPVSYVSIDVALGLPMFLRLYLLLRTIMYHSELFRKSSCQSFGYLNKVSINFSFLMKTYLEQSPVESLLLISFVLCIIGTWSFRASNYTATNEHMSVTDSLWLFMVTYTVIGYADLYPNTQCARIVAIIICALGLMAGALLVTVFTLQLLLNRPEKYLYTFVVNSELASERKEQAANVIKYALQVWLQKKSRTKYPSIQRLQAQRKLFESISAFKEIKREQQLSIDSCVGPIEIITLQRQTNDNTTITNQQLVRMKARVTSIDEQLSDMKNTITSVQNTLQMLVQQLDKDRSA